MGISEALSMCGGLALFLYGMHMMSSGLEAAAGNKMKQLLEKLTSNTIMGVIVGAVITAIIQSSSATTVMLVGFVNAGIMDLSQTVGIIMGANIGATMNGVLLSVGIGDIAPAFAFIGVCLIQFSKDDKKKDLGEIIAGLGILFIGMNMMSSSMGALRSSEKFINLLATCKNPLIGVIVGAVFTALIQSSSASVGILQALAVSGVVSLDTGIYLMFGFTIGTCITAALAAIGTTANAKRTTVIHFMFNVIGTLLFIVFCQVLPVVSWIEAITPNSPAAQVANAHVIFKVVTTLILLPFANALVRFATLVVRDRSAENRRPTIAERAKLTAGYSMGNSAIIINIIREEINYMYELTKKNVELAYDAVIRNSGENQKLLAENEDEIDRLNATICEYISSIMPIATAASDSKIISGYYLIVGNIERIGDHATNFADYQKYFANRNIGLSERAIGEVEIMKAKTLKAMEYLEGDKRDSAPEVLTAVQHAEQEMDDMTDSYRDAQLERMKNTSCSPEASVIYSEMLTDFERIGDHLLNIAEEYAGMYAGK